MIPFDHPRPKIAVLRALQLGDLLCSIPAIRALRNNFPEAEIILLGLPWSALLIERFPGYFDRHIHFPGYPDLPEQVYVPGAWKEFVRKMEIENVDLLVQMQGNGTVVNELLPLLGAKELAGFKPANGRSPGPFFMEYPDTIDEVHRHMGLMNFLGIPATNAKLEFPLHKTDFEKLGQLLQDLKKSPYVCVHPGSRAGWRQWPPDHFALMADHCASIGFTVIFTGTSEEVPIITEVQKWMRYESINLGGRTDLGTVAALISNATLLIANCTGVSHIAAATQTPSLIISMDGEPNRWSPADRRRHTVIDWLAHPTLRTVYETLINKLGTLIES